MCVDLGPDLAAMVMEIEQKFGVTIPDEEAEKIRTMGQLYDFVLARVARGQPQVCVTSAAFYRLRRALGEVCRVPRERVRLGALLEDLVPFHDRPRYWQELQTPLSNPHLPRLRRPAWLAKRIEAASLVPFFLTGLCAIVLIVVLGRTPAASVVAMLAVPIPVTAREGQTYTIHISRISGTTDAAQSGDLQIVKAPKGSILQRM